MNYPTRISTSGLTIYDHVRDNESLFMPIVELENTLRKHLIGLDLDYPL